MTTIHNLTAKEIHAIMQALRIADEAGELREFIKPLTECEGLGV